VSLLSRTPPLPCQELVELVTAYLDGGLSRRDRRRFEAHISGCEHCTAYLEQMRETIAATGRLTEADLDPEARDELIAVFAGWSEGRGHG
jgi:anti-sigma factor RsiW